MSFGASLSVKQCRNFNVEPAMVLQAAIKELGIRRFRLMSYWNEIEIARGVYDFTELDRQVALIGRHKGEITMCLGVRQPRWPESHWPDWTQNLAPNERNRLLSRFIAAVVDRYKKCSAVVSWQLENEALLTTFGEQGDFDRQRLCNEFELVKRLDKSRPVIMTTSTSWGIPLRKPIPDIVGFSLYRITHNKGRYQKSVYQPWVFRLRGWLVALLWRRPCFIHELQAEPWGPKNIWEMSNAEKAKSMNTQILATNIRAAIKTNLTTIDLWGLEWWYAEKQQGKPAVWNTVRSTIRYNKGDEKEINRS